MTDRKSGSKDGKKGTRRSKGVEEVYEGEKSKDGKREGRGICRIPGGDSYEGEWKNNKMDGHGCYRMADGDVYEGAWKHGLKDGPGTYYYASGNADIVNFAAGEEEEGVRFTADRALAWKLNKGHLAGEITLDEANEILERIGEALPPPKDSSPNLRVTGGGPIEPMTIPEAVTS